MYIQRSDATSKSVTLRSASNKFFMFLPQTPFNVLIVRLSARSRFSKGKTQKKKKKHKKSLENMSAMRSSKKVTPYFNASQFLNKIV